MAGLRTDCGMFWAAASARYVGRWVSSQLDEDPPAGGGQFHPCFRDDPRQPFAHLPAADQNTERPENLR